jgi:hypothetical protein
MSTDWVKGVHDEFIDIHSVIRPFEKVVTFFEIVERDLGVLEYCNGRNESGRWIFQIYNVEFIVEIIETIQNEFKIFDGPILEVMCGDGKLTEFLREYTSREIIATDSKSDNHDIAYPKWVVELDALQAIKKYNPSLIVACWEPFFSTLGEQIIATEIPFAWIGDPDRCAPHSDILSYEHIKMGSKFALGRHDSFLKKKFSTDVHLFNL